MYEVVELVGAAWEAGVDAVIVQDLGLLSVLARSAPEIRLHVSTQVGAHNVETARLLGCEPEILPDLIEIDRGHWEGHEGPEIKRRWGNLWSRWYDDPAGLAGLQAPA